MTETICKTCKNYFASEYQDGTKTFWCIAIKATLSQWEDNFLIKCTQYKKIEKDDYYD